MIQVVNKITPIIILLIIGKGLQTFNVISDQTVVELKKIVVNLALPAVLFISFLYVNLQAKYFWFVPIIFVYCVLLFFLGSGLYRLFNISGEYFPFLTTGFEYGMIGVSLFGAAYGLDQIGKIAIVDLGQETFIWFVYVALLIHKRDGVTNPGKLLKLFSTSPVIIAILVGLFLNTLGLPKAVDDIHFAEGLLAAINLVGSLTVPVILLVVGYGIQVDMKEFYYSARIILFRLIICIPTALILNRYIVQGLMGLDAGFEAALFTLLILPPPFILTLFMKQNLKEEIHSVNNTLTLHTIVTIIIFIIYYALNPVI